MDRYVRLLVAFLFAVFVAACLLATIDYMLR